MTGVPLATVPLAMIVPGDVTRATGGNVWDRRVRRALEAAGRAVAWLPVDGAWPEPSGADLERLAAALTSRPDGSAVLVDGLVGCGAPAAVLPALARLRVGVVVHLPLAAETGLAPATAARLAVSERTVLEAVDVVVVTSAWTVTYGLPGVRLRRPAVVAEPGTDRDPGFDTGTGSGSGSGSLTDRHEDRRDGGHLLCLGSLTRRKGQRVLVAALARLGAEAPTPAPANWRVRLVGEQPDAAELAAVRDAIAAAGLRGRVELLGPVTGEALAEQWRWADLLVVPSLVETYGMVVTEALAHGLPVVGSSGGALPATLGTTAAGPPGLLVPPGDPDALADVLARWLADAALRTTLRTRARDRAAALPGWDRTAASVATAFTGACA